MTEYDDNMRGACWPNRNKTSDSQPDYRGNLTIDGRGYWVSMWIDPEAEGNRPPIKFSLRPKDGQESQAQKTGLQAIKKLVGGETTAPVPSDFDDDIPF